MPPQGHAGGEKQTINRVSGLRSPFVRLFRLTGLKSWEKNNRIMLFAGRIKKREEKNFCLISVEA